MPESTMAGSNPAEYGCPIQTLLQRAPLNPLDAGQLDESVRPLLEALSDESFQPKAVRDHNMAAACRAGLWLRFNYLDESHKISQDIDTPEGSFWHGILHRREGDFDNAKYWFRRVGRHANFESLRQAAASIATSDPRTMSLVGQKEWDPFSFVDLCAAAVRGEAESKRFCQEVQLREWELLFDYCWRQAVG
jgi:hypothetical protein